MANILLPILPGTLPQGYCFTSWQQTLVDFSNHQQAVLANGMAFYNYGSTAPAPEFQIYPWLNTNDMRWYRFSGQWITNHEFLPGRHTWEEFVTEADIWSFDGGDGSDPSTSPPTATAGAMWQLDTAYDGRSPMSPGVIVGSNPAKTLGYGEDFGEGAHLQDREEVGPHVHPLTPRDQMEDTGGGNIDGITVSGTGPSIGTLSAGQNTYASTQQAMNVTHPVRGMCCIVRTGRIYRTAP